MPLMRLLELRATYNELVSVAIVDRVGIAAI